MLLSLSLAYVAELVTSLMLLSLSLTYVAQLVTCTMGKDWSSMSVGFQVLK